MNTRIFILFICQFVSSNAWLFNQPTFNFMNYSSKLPHQLSGFMTSFGDFNADRRVDIFVLAKSNNTQHIDVILMPKDNSKIVPQRIRLINDTNGAIRNVFTGDFNGDSLLDIVTCNANDVDGPYSLDIAYGIPDRDNVKPPVAVYPNISFIAQPLHLDWNSDMIGDIFGQLNTPQREFVVLIGSTNSTFTLKKLPHLLPTTKKFDKLSFSYFVDLNEDGQADILLIVNKGADLALISLLKNDAGFEYDKYVPVNQNAAMMGQPVIGDFMFRGVLHMVFQFCIDYGCQDSRLMACDLRELGCQQANFSTTVAGVKMAFQTSNAANARLSLAPPDLVAMSCGDLKMSGSIGCLATMVEVDNPANFRLMRIDNGGNFRFSLVPLEGQAALFANVVQAAIFDILEDVMLIVVSVLSNASSMGSIDRCID